MNSRNPGFTLLELTAAIVITGMTLSIAAAALYGTGDRARFIDASSERRAQAANGERLLRQLLLSSGMPSDTTPPLTGNRTHMRFHSWCATPREWLEPCNVELFIEAAGEGQLVRAALGIGAHGAVPEVSLEVSERVRVAEFAYLEDARYGGSWRASWSNSGVPYAVGLVLDGDTLILPTGRGQ